MFKEVPIAQALRVAFGGGIAGLALLASPAFAQTGTQGDLVQTGERVEVTGSSIKRIDAETALPVQILTREDITRLAPQNTEELLRNISATNTVGATQVSNGSGATTSGISSVSLRGLGAKRTLVLVNGRRIAPFGGVAGGGGVAAVDVNSIPVAAIERIEVLKEGASAVYGSDAVAGVINFILRSDYQGALAEAQYGQTTHSGDGYSYQASTVLGFGDIQKDRFNAMVTASYNKEAAIYGRQRNYANTSVNASEGQDTTSGNTYPGNIVSAAGSSRNFLAPRFAGQYPTFGSTNCAPGVPRSSTLLGSTTVLAADCRYDPANEVALIPEQQRTAVGISGRFAITPETQLYGEANASRNVVKYKIQATPISDQFSLVDSNPYTPQLNALLAANNAALTNAYGPDFVGTLAGHTTFLLPTTSPYYPTAFAAANGLAGSPIDIRYRSVESGQRMIRDTNRADRFLFGIKGSAYNWDYDLGVLHTESRVAENADGGYPLYSKLLPLLNSGVVNPFGPSTPAVQQQLQAANFVGEAFNSKTSFTSVNGHASREIYNLPAGPLALAVGGDFRRERYRFTAGTEVASGDVSGYGGNFLDVATARNVEAGFAELNIPILKSLEGDIAVRYDNYEHVGNTTNPRASLRFQPAQEILLRASVGTGFRAPSLDELAAPVTQGVSTNGLSDPLRCPVTGSSNDCQTQFTTSNGGNASLQPEKSTSTTFGFVLEPTRDVHFGVDYFDIRLRNQIVIGGVSADTILSDTASATQYASLVTRAPSTTPGLPGQIVSINNQNLNLYKLNVRGLDFDFKLRLPTEGVGRWTVGLNGTYFLSYDQQNSDGSFTGEVANANVAGGSVIPRWKHIASVTYDYGPWSGSFIQNFQSAYADYPSNVLGNERRVGVYETFDVQGSYTGFKGFRLTAGIKNLFDKDPPYSNIGGVGYFQTGYDPSYADVRGRFLYARLGYEFK